jgi:PPM family protein phosphatase
VADQGSGDEAAGNGPLADQGIREMLQWGLRSDPGSLRDRNEDCAGAFAQPGPATAWDRGPLFVVADGLGGHTAGHVASRLAVDRALTSWTSGPPQPPNNALRNGVRDANVEVFDASLQPNRRGMGTTIVALTVAGREALVAHVGDSRAYLVRGEDCAQLTADHSRVAEMVRMKLLAPEKAINHPARSQLTRSLGGDPLVQIELSRRSVAAGDALVLCTDGLWEMVSRQEVAAHTRPLPADGLPARAAADRLVELAVKRGAPDNVTCLVVRITSNSAIPSAAAKRGFFRRGTR